MRSTYRALALLVAAGVLVQAAAIAFGWFDVIHDVDNGTVIDEDFEGNAGHAVHGTVGMMVMPLLALALLVVSFFARVDGGRTWAGLVLGAVVLQITLAFVSFGAPVVGVLHGLNAFLLFGVAMMAAQTVKNAPAGSSASTGERVGV